MDDLMHVKQVIAQTANDLQADDLPERSGIKSALYGLFMNGVIAFDHSYDAFIGSIGQDPITFDRWLNIQMQVWTDLGTNRQQLITDFEKMFESVLKQTDGGETYVKHSATGNFSFTCALMFRVYMDQLVVRVEEPVGGEEGKQ